MNRAYAARVPVAGPDMLAGAQSSIRLTSMGGMGMLLLGVLAAVPVNFVGRIYIGETLLGLCSPFAIPLVFALPGRYGRVAKLLLAGMIVSWLGYIASDLYRGTPTFDYMRGWFRWVALLSTYATLAWLGSKNIRYAIFFMLGWCVGSVVYPVVAGVPLNLPYWWKFYAGFPACFIVAYFAGKFGPNVAALTMLGMGAVSIALDSRSILIACLLTAVLTVFAGRRKGGTKRPTKGLTKGRIVLALGTVAICGLASVFIVQKVGERFGYAERFHRSNVKRMVNIEVAYTILKRSPLIGYGSWARDPEIARIRDRIVSRQIGNIASRSDAQRDLVIVHSQILQSWVEGGLLGLVFFVLYGWQLAEKGLRLTVQLKYEPLLPAMSLVIVVAAWHFFASPFGGSARVLIVVSCVVVSYLADRSQVATAPAAVAWQRRPWQSAGVRSLST